MGLRPIRCDCGGLLYRDANGRAVCEACKGVVTMESLLPLGLQPMWDEQKRLVTHAKDVWSGHPDTDKHWR